MQQSTDEQNRMGWLLLKQRLRKNKQTYKHLNAKIADKGTYYRGYSTDRANLINLSYQIHYQTLLDDAYRQRLEPDKALKAAPGDLSGAVTPLAHSSAPDEEPKKKPGRGSSVSPLLAFAENR